MKYALLIGDGMADRPLKVLGDRTPLQVSKTPNMDEIACRGMLGLVRTVSRRMGQSSDIAIMSILGYEPSRYYTGRGPFEAASMGVSLGKGDIAFRCNLVTVDDKALIDYSSGHISTKEAKVLIEFLNSRLDWSGLRFYPGVGYRHLAVINTGVGKFEGVKPGSLKCYAPHDVVGQRLERILPRGIRSRILRELMYESRKLLEKHEINDVRRQLKENPANMIWLWGQGRSPALPQFKVRGAVVSAVDVVKGIGVCAGLTILNVPGATGYFDTDYDAKARYAINALADHDFILVHVEAPDEAGHIGDTRAKINAIENFDSKIVGPVLSYARVTKDFRVCILPDHATPVEVKTHVGDMVPFVIYGSGVDKRSGLPFDEESARKTGIRVAGPNLMKLFLAG